MRALSILSKLIRRQFRRHHDVQPTLRTKWSQHTCRQFECLVQREWVPGKIGLEQMHPCSSLLLRFLYRQDCTIKYVLLCTHQRYRRKYSFWGMSRSKGYTAHSPSSRKLIIRISRQLLLILVTLAHWIILCCRLGRSERLFEHANELMIKL